MKLTPLAVNLIGLVTTTFAVPAVWVGVTQVILLPVTTVMLVAKVPPILTTEPVAKLAPLIVINVPPAVGPEVGEIEDNLSGETGA